MSKYKLLFDIIKHLEEFEKKKENGTIQDFSVYLNEAVFVSKYKLENIDFEEEENNPHHKLEEVEFSALLISLSRFTKHYVKKAFKNNSFNSIDEFGFLATLVKEKSLLKSELINKHLLEISTGSEVLRRLSKNNLIYEYKDSSDGRAKRVALTPQGHKEVMIAFDEMYRVAHIITGNLKNEALMEVTKILRKLSVFHRQIHTEDKDADIQIIYDKYIKTTLRR